MAKYSKKGKRKKRIRLSLTDEATRPSEEDLLASRQLAKRHSRLVLAMMDAEEYQARSTRETTMG